jgi:hypothetical protein
LWILDEKKMKKERPRITNFQMKTTYCKKGSKHYDFWMKRITTKGTTLGL